VGEGVTWRLWGEIWGAGCEGARARGRDGANCEGDLRNPDYQTTQLSEKEGFIQDLCFKIR